MILQRVNTDAFLLGLRFVIFTRQWNEAHNAQALRDPDQVGGAVLEEAMAADIQTLDRCLVADEVLVLPVTLGKQLDHAITADDPVFREQAFVAPLFVNFENVSH